MKLSFLDSHLLHHRKLRLAGTFLSGCIAASAVIALLASCSGSKRTENPGDNPDDTYHADNDIAMTVSSIADALRVGQELDSIEYDFEGVLTDGQGKPLYTDLTGSPGAWSVNVVSPDRVSIRNLYLGDLLPEDLTQYLVNFFSLSDKDLLEDSHLDDEADTQIVIYRLGQADLRIISRTALAADGTKGPLVNIIVEQIQ